MDGSRAYRTLDDYQLPAPAFEAMRASGDLRLAVPSGFPEWYEDRRTLLTRRMSEVEHAAATGELVDVTIERGQLLISPIRRSPSDDAEALKTRLYAMMPRVRITDLLVEVAAWSGFADLFVHARSGAPASDRSALMGAILADATNLGLGRMAESSRGLTLPRLRWTAEWHVRDETYLSALAAIVDHHTAYPLARVWGPGDTSSSDGQFFRAGGQGEARADRNARYGPEPDLFGGTTVHHQHRARHPPKPTTLARDPNDPPAWCRDVRAKLDPETQAAMLASAANWLRVGQRVQIVSLARSIDGRPERRLGRVGTVWRICSPVFPEWTYVNLDLIGAERSEKVEFLEIRDLEPIE